ncbi:MAG: ARMT1-like domain-containing protein [Desulfurococcaceae archaeon]
MTRVRLIAMKPEFECLRCILTTRLRELENTRVDTNRKLIVAWKLLGYLAREFSLTSELTIIASNSFNLVVNEVPEVSEYYSRIKKACNESALKNIAVHEKYVEELSGFERFEYLVKLSAIGNLIDYGVADHEAVKPEFVNPGFVTAVNYCVNHTEKFYHAVKNGGKRVLWLFDNNGEAVYDILLVKEIKRMGNVVWSLVKNDPGFQNDVTVKDAVELGLTRFLDNLVSYGCSSSTIHLDRISQDAKHLLNEADLVVAKGMSHYEYLSETDLGKPIVFILVPKCRPVARKIGNEKCQGGVVVYFKDE